MFKNLTYCTLFLSILLNANVLFATDFHVNPVTGSANGDGSITKPWKTIQEVIESKLIQTKNWVSLPAKGNAAMQIKNPSGPIKSGDNIILYNGFHGEISIIGAYNSANITIKAAPGHSPKVEKVLIRSASNWIVDGLKISPSFGTKAKPTAIVEVMNHGFTGPGHDIQIKNSEIFSVPSITGWSAEDWLSKASNAVQVNCENSTIENNKIYNIRFGISSSGKRAIVRKNSITDFAGDALRGLGDHSLFEYNTVTRGYHVNDNHDDAFQSWSIGSDGKVGQGKVVGVTLRGNIFINGHDDKNTPLRATFQGIGCFDGYFEDWLIENNVIIVDHWHGITLLGANRVKVINNTVIDLYDDRPGPSWIRIGNHKNGTSGTGNIIRNNLSNNIIAGDGVTADHNIKVTNPAEYFLNIAAKDLRLKSTSLAIDAGSTLLAPKIDILGNIRPMGSGIDLGAYEFKMELPQVPLAPQAPLNLKVE